MPTKSRLFIPIAVSALLLTLTACGGASSPSSGAAGANEEGESYKPVEISIMTITPSTPPAADDNVIKLEIEKLTHTKLDIQWVSNNVYDDKLNLTLASGQIPDLTYVSDPFSPSFRSLVKEGAIWDLTPYIKDYPNLLQGIPDVAWELTKMEDGGNYGIPRGRDANDVSFFVLRKDWLDKVGLASPTTTEELYQTLKAFAQQDPDGNGKPDTYGLTADLQTLIGTFQGVFTGVTGSWAEENGKLTYAPFLPETRESLAYLTKLYQEKLLPEDLLTLKTTQVRDYYIGNRAGAVIDKTGTGPTVYTPGLKKIVPTYKESDFFPLTSINGYVPKGTGFAGILAIPKSVPEEKLLSILKLVNDWLAPEVSSVQRFGIEGVHYKEENGVKVVEPDKLKADNASDFNQIVNSIDPALNPAPASEELEAFQQARSEADAKRGQVNVSDIGVGLYSAEAEKLLPDLQKRILDLQSKIIIGSEPLSAWDELVSKTQSDPKFVRATEELTAAYLKRAGQ